MEEELPAIVLDIGSAFTKAGFAGDDYPRGSEPMPTLVGLPKSSVGVQETAGDVAFLRRYQFRIVHPVKRGLIQDWDCLEKLLYYSYWTWLRSHPKTYGVLWSESSLKLDRKKITQLMFEKFEVPAFHLVNQGVLALMATGRTNGIVLEVGDGCSQSIPVVEGYALRHAIMEVDFAGYDLTRYWMESVGASSEFASDTILNHDVMRIMKEKLCHVALDYESSKNDTSVVEYELPDGSIIKAGNERFKCAELLFQPHLIGLDILGIHESVITSIRKCDIDCRKLMFNNIILSGGSTLMKGIVERLRNELVESTSSCTKIAVKDVPERRFLPWIGGSIAASLSTFQSLAISATEFAEAGSNILYRKYQ
ncbi:hypothetical protein NAEGRDRAFT_60797 [Naegleria gruberi]|uniref:Actin n=1 Tax=Naegleria gruberi TaxID=5762 RepID=D2VNZ3_NAEGR|nr:uncharacterized protein NAEGRDRAFT_60797 [Naegleria gruberi]EFC41506.1 hypothetical protein NAEGRDRAFT_60797 [Naegleria gruberi]|eukprot:XP_002674250.1 hypothetical protein NAEGRDRAFT_60797 [Naegleria gruberi strain NEG-M]